MRDMELNLDRIRALSERLRQADLILECNQVYGPFLEADGSQRYCIPSDIFNLPDKPVETRRVSNSRRWNHVRPWVCDCPDYQNRQDLHGGFCKHVLAVLLAREASPPTLEIQPRGSQEDMDDLEEKIRELY